MELRLEKTRNLQKENTTERWGDHFASSPYYKFQPPIVPTEFTPILKLTKRIQAIVSILLLAAPCLGLFGQATSSEIDYVDRGTQLFWENIDSSIYYFQQGLTHYETQEDWNNYVQCLNALTSCQGIKGNFTQSHAYAVKAMEIAEKHLPKSGTVYGSTLNNLAIYARRKGDYEQAITYYQKALAIEQQSGDLANEITVLNNMGKCYLSKGDIFEAQRLFNQVLHLGLKDFGATNPKISRAYRELANIYQTTGQIDTALFLYQKALDLITQNTSIEVTFKARQQQEIHLRMAEIFFDKKMEAAFKKQIHQAINRARIAFGREPEQAYLLLGKWELQQQLYPAALANFNKALKLNEEKYQDLGVHPEIGEVYFQLAQVYKKKGNLTSSLQQLQYALLQYTKNFQPDDLSENPLAEDLAIDQNLLKLLKEKAEIAFRKYDQNKDPKDLQVAQATYALAIQMLNQLRKSYLNTSSKEILAENVLSIFEGALKTTFLEYQLNPQAAVFNKAFQIAENGKAILLLESIIESTALGVAGIPDSLLQKEKELKIDIAYYEKQKALTNTKETGKLKTIEEGLYALEEKHRELLHLIEEKYPAYHQLKYDTDIVSLQEVQQKLAQQPAALVEYFVGEETIYIFYISSTNFSLARLKKDPRFNEQVQAIRKLLIEPPRVEQAANDFDKFTKTAHTLYRQLIAPLDLGSGDQQLFIIPDDILAYLPFEILLKKLPEEKAINYSPQALSYLLNNFQISYNYSATLLLRQQELKEQAAHDFIGFAPSFENKNVVTLSSRACSMNQLQDLNCNKEEVQQINKIFAGLAMTGAAATKEKFQQVIRDYRIVHFATHSCLDDENPMLNKIFLADDYLSNFDLYNLQLNTELAVLSACNTGSGQLRRGEGVMSLSRGFLHAGCPSILMSLWSVEDCTTSIIMSQYYQNIKAGNNKGLALQDAKLRYLETANKLERHPYYWAAFVQFGDVEAMEFDQSKSGKRYLLLIGLLGFFFIFFLWKKVSK